MAASSSSCITSFTDAATDAATDAMTPKVAMTQSRAVPDKQPVSDPLFPLSHFQPQIPGNINFQNIRDGLMAHGLIVQSLSIINHGGQYALLVSCKTHAPPILTKQLVFEYVQGVPTLQCLSQAYILLYLQQSTSIPAPRVVYVNYDYKPDVPEHIAYDHIGGITLEDAWPLIPTAHRATIMTKVSSLILTMFTTRFKVIGKFMWPPDRAEGFRYIAPIENPKQWLERCGNYSVERYHFGPFATVDAWLKSLATRITADFEKDINKKARSKGKGRRHADQPVVADITPTPEDVVKVKSTWARLQDLIPYHVGGCWIGDLHPEDKQHAIPMFSSREYALDHGDLQLSRFIVTFPDEQSWNWEEAELTLTGWTHARAAPLWSTARLPSFLIPGSPGPLDEATKEAMTNVLKKFLLSSSAGQQWIAAYLYGWRERAFQGLLSAPWYMHGYVDKVIERIHADIAKEKPFMLTIGQDHRIAVRPSASKPPATPTKPISENPAGKENVEIPLEPKQLKMNRKMRRQNERLKRT